MIREFLPTDFLRNLMAPRHSQSNPNPTCTSGLRTRASSAPYCQRSWKTQVATRQWSQTHLKMTLAHLAVLKKSVLPNSNNTTFNQMLVTLSIHFLECSKITHQILWTRTGNNTFSQNRRSRCQSWAAINSESWLLLSRATWTNRV